MQFLEHRVQPCVVCSVVAGHVMIAIHRVHNLETNRAGPISSQILVISEHILSTLKGKELEIYLYSTVRAWTMLGLCLLCVSSSRCHGLACSQ